jgi:NCAIR mutase (PurE)-related protein
MDMSRLSQYVEDEFQTFLELLCPSVIVLKSQVPKESIEISNILIKEENIEVLSKVKEETIKLLSKGKKVLQIVKKETIKLPKTEITKMRA